MFAWGLASPHQLRGIGKDRVLLKRGFRTLQSDLIVTKCLLVGHQRHEPSRQYHSPTSFGMLQSHNPQTIGSYIGLSHLTVASRLSAELLLYKIFFMSLPDSSGLGRRARSRARAVSPRGTETSLSLRKLLGLAKRPRVRFFEGHPGLV